MTAKEFQTYEGGEVSEITTQIETEMKSAVSVQKPCQDVHQEMLESAASVESKMERPHSLVEVDDLLVDHDTNIIDVIALTEKVVNLAESSETALQETTEPSQGLHHDVPEPTTPAKNKFEEPQDVMLKNHENKAIDIIAPLEYEAVKSRLEAEKLSVDQESESSTKRADEDVKDYILPDDNRVIEHDIKFEALSSFTNTKNDWDEVSIDCDVLDFAVQINDISKKTFRGKELLICLMEYILYYIYYICTYITNICNNTFSYYTGNFCDYDSSSNGSTCESFNLSSEFLNPEDSTPFEPIIKEPPAGLKEKTYTVKSRGMLNTSSACYIISVSEFLRLI